MYWLNVSFSNDLYWVASSVFYLHGGIYFAMILINFIEKRLLSSWISPISVVGPSNPWCRWSQWAPQIGHHYLSKNNLSHEGCVQVLTLNVNPTVFYLQSIPIITNSVNTLNRYYLWALRSFFFTFLHKYYVLWSSLLKMFFLKCSG